MDMSKQEDGLEASGDLPLDGREGEQSLDQRPLRPLPAPPAYGCLNCFLTISALRWPFFKDYKINPSQKLVSSKKCLFPRYSWITGFSWGNLSYVCGTQDT